jgi:hypothetical protein
MLPLPPGSAALVVYYNGNKYFASFEVADSELLILT